jgi:DNA (cytosine-5)-methyltransferase 1
VTLRWLSLFAGIGGLDLGLHRAGAGETVAFCEIEPYARRVLAKNFPGVPIYGDVRDLTAERLAADGLTPNAICGGFPCQDLSRAGKRGGLAGERSGLWTEFARLIRELKPRYVFVENVPELLVRGMDIVLRDMAASGYDAEWEGIPAAAVDSPQLRARQWLLAYPVGLGDRLSQAAFHAGRDTIVSGGWWASEPELVRVADGLPNRVDRLRCLGNAVVPQVAEVVGRCIVAAECKQRMAA